MSLPNRPPPDAAPPGPVVVVAHEPRAYREALAGALATLRPAAAVAAVEPAELERAVARARPDLVFCGELTAAVSACARGWVLLYPGGAPRVETCIAGERAVLADLGLADALALVDRAAALAAVRAAPPGGR